MVLQNGGRFFFLIVYLPMYRGLRNVSIDDDHTKIPLLVTAAILALSFQKGEGNQEVLLFLWSSRVFATQYAIFL